MLSDIFPHSSSQQGVDPTAKALEQCEKWVLRPYRTVLKLVIMHTPASVSVSVSTHVDYFMIDN